MKFTSIGRRRSMVDVNLLIPSHSALRQCHSSSGTSTPLVFILVSFCYCRLLYNRQYLQCYLFLLPSLSRRISILYLVHRKERNSGVLYLLYLPANCIHPLPTYYFDQSCRQIYSSLFKVWTSETYQTIKASRPPSLAILRLSPQQRYHHSSRYF
jgi:hypothetical protein